MKNERVVEYNNLPILKIGFPKTGNVWLTNILKKLLIYSNIGYKTYIGSLPEYKKIQIERRGAEQFVYDEVFLRENACYFIVENGLFIEIKDINNFLQKTSLVWTHTPISDSNYAFYKNFNKIIYIVRDPRAVIESLSYWDANLQGGEKQIAPQQILQNSFPKWLNNWIMHSCSAIFYKDKLNIHFVFYERLKMDFDNEIMSLLNYLDIELDIDTIHKIKQETSFDTMKKYDRNKVHVRSGQVAGWGNILTEDYVRQIEKFSSPLLEYFNYPVVFSDNKKYILPKTQSYLDGDILLFTEEWHSFQNGIIYLKRLMLNKAKINLKRDYKYLSQYVVNVHLGKIMRLEGYLDDGLMFLMKTLDDIDGPVEWLCFEIAMVFIEKKDMEKAKSYLDKEDQLFPKPAIQVQIGRIMYLENHLDNALKFLLDLFEKYKREEWLCFEIAMIFIKKQNIKKAIEFLHKEDELFPKVFTKTYIGKAYRLEGNIEESLTYLISLLEQNTEHMYIRRELSVSYSLTGDIDKAAHYLFEEERKFCCKTIYELYTLALACKKHNKTDKSIEYFNMLIERKYIDDSLKGKAYFHLGEIYFLQSKHKEAYEMLSICLKVIPDYEKAIILLRKCKIN